MASSISQRLADLEARNAKVDAARTAALEKADDPETAFVTGAQLREVVERLEKAETELKKLKGITTAHAVALKDKDK